jgi:putative ABC transport system permease protein
VAIFLDGRNDAATGVRMTLLSLAWASLKNRRVATALTVISIALSVALLVGVEQIRAGARESFSGTISQTDLIVGPRSGTVSLLLYTVFRMGAPLNNIRYETWEHFDKHPAVEWTIPLTFGDSHQGYRVVGTNDSFYAHYRFRRTRQVEFAQGRKPQDKLDVALGAEVAEKLGYKLGAKIVLTHGVAGGMHQHDDQPFTVAGILARTATPIDRSLYITFAGVEAMHEGWEDGAPPADDHKADEHKADDHKVGEHKADQHKHADHDHEKAEGHEDHDHPVDQVSAFLVKMKSRIDTLRLQREVSTFAEEPLSAVIPGVALAELWSNLRYAEDALRVVSLCVLIAGLLGMLVALYTTLNERRREMAILRAAGVTAGNIVGLLVCESILLATAGAALGVAAYYAIAWVAQAPVERHYGLYIPIRSLTADSLWYLAAVVAAAAVIGLIPAWRAYRNTLSDGLAQRF